MNTPNPGSPEAVKLGCKCPVVDNGRGQGCGRRDETGEPRFWISGDCKVHAK